MLFSAVVRNPAWLHSTCPEPWIAVLRYRCHAAGAIVLIALLAGQVSTASAQASGFSRKDKPFAAISRMFLREQVRDSLVELTRSQVGLKYRWGAKQPGKAFDCSGLVQWVMANFNVELPRTSREQAKLGLEIPKDPAKLLPGDLLYFGKGRVVDHIGIYVGDGKYIHAARTSKGVIEAELPTGRAARTWWKGVRRVFAHEEEVEQLPEVMRSPLMLPTFVS